MVNKLSRKSQLEKFEARMAKAKMDEDVIKKSNIDNSTLEKTGEKIVKKYGLSTEDIFAIITRDSIGSFIHLWNNSMENVLRETLRTEIRDIVKDVIRDEMMEAYMGIIKGMGSINIKEIIKEETEDFIKNDLMTVNREETDSIKKQVRRRSKKMTDYRPELEAAIIDAKIKGFDPHKGSEFKNINSRNSSLYTYFMKDNKGIKGAWKKHVDNILNDF